MAWLAALLELLRFLEFLVSPLGLCGLLWVSLYEGMIWGMSLDRPLSGLLSGLIAMNFYGRLMQD